MASLGLVVALAWVFGWPTRHGEFLSGDDQRFVTNHVLVNHPSLAHAGTLLTIVHDDLYQPLPMLSLQLDYALAAARPDSRFAVSPLPFHLTNIFLHMINAALAWAIALRLSRRRAVALLVGCMFACHPFALEPVAWISGRMILLSTTFALLTILLCLRRPGAEGDSVRRGDEQKARPRSVTSLRTWLGGLSWLASLASKVLPSVPVAAAWCDRASGSRMTPRRYGYYVLLLGIGLAAAWYALGATEQLGVVDAMGEETTTRLPVRMLLAWRYYVENYVWPARLAAWSPPPLDVTFASLPVIPAIAELIGFAAVAAAVRRRAPLVFIGLVLFAILLAPFLAASAARRFLAADRYMYLPMLGLHLAVAAAFVQLGDRLPGRGSRTAALVLSVFPAAALVVGWMLVGHHLAPSWRDTVSRDRRVASVYHGNVLALDELARAYLFENRPDEALDIVEQARKRRPDHPRLMARAGEAYRLKGDWFRARAELASAVEQMPRHLRTRYQFALTLEAMGDAEGARKEYATILGQDPGFLPAVTALARRYQKQGDGSEARAMWQRAAEINPFHRDALLNLALFDIGEERWNEAAQRLKAIIALTPEDRSARFHLAVVRVNQGRHKAALAIYDRLLSQDPGDIRTMLNRAQALAAMNRSPQAEQAYRQALSLEPDSISAAIGLHELLQAQYRFREILDLWFNLRGSPEADPRIGAYLVWAYVLNNEIPNAERVRQAIAPAAPERAFADWARIYADLRRGAFESAHQGLVEIRIETEAAPARREQARIISAALADLPGSVRGSSAGQLALAKLFAFYGDLESAGAVAQELAHTRPANKWTEAARDLLDSIEAASMESASSLESARD